MAECEKVTEQVKADNQIDWIAQMNNICNRVRKIINSELIFI